MPSVLYVSTYSVYDEWNFSSKLPAGWGSVSVPMYDLADAALGDHDVVYVPGIHDQIFLKEIADRFVAYVQRGGNLLVNGHIAIPWLPWLSEFRLVPDRPYTNWRIRPADPGPYFAGVDFDTFHLWDGVLGQYGRGYSPPPDGAQSLCLIGGPGGEGPIDWVWQCPAGGRLFMHNGDNIDMFKIAAGADRTLLSGILEALVD